MKTLGIMVGFVGVALGITLFIYMFYTGVVDVFNGIRYMEAGKVAIGLLTWGFKEILAVAVAVVGGLAGAWIYEQE